MTESKTQSDDDEQVVITQEDLDRKEKILSRRGQEKRVYFGQSNADVFRFKPTPISEKEGLFAVAEYVAEIVRDDYTNVERIIETPKDLSQPDARLQFEVEMMRFFMMEVGFYVVYLSQECNHAYCSKMQATTKFRYRCSAHRKPKDCNAIQYCVHTLDLFTEKLNNREYNVCSPHFNKIPEKKAKKDLGDLCRRMYRIFAHAFYHHQSLFDDYESEYLLCTRFIAFFKKHQLVPPALFKREIQIPAESLYLQPADRKERLQKYALKKKQLQEQEQSALENAAEFMKNTNVAELEGDEVY